MPLLAPMLVLLAATPSPEDVPALLRVRTEQLLDGITRGDSAVWEQAPARRCWPASVPSRRE